MLVPQPLIGGIGIEVLPRSVAKSWMLNSSPDTNPSRTRRVAEPSVVMVQGVPGAARIGLPSGGLVPGVQGEVHAARGEPTPWKLNVYHASGTIGAELAKGATRLTPATATTAQNSM